MSATNAKPRFGFLQEPSQKTAKLFKNGRSQAVRLPKEFAFAGSEVLIRHDSVTGEVILSSSAALQSEPWQARFAVWDSLGSADDGELERDETAPVERDFF